MNAKVISFGLVVLGDLLGFITSWDIFFTLPNYLKQYLSNKKGNKAENRKCRKYYRVLKGGGVQGEGVTGEP